MRQPQRARLGLVFVIMLLTCAAKAQTANSKDGAGRQSIAPSVVVNGQGFGPIPDGTVGGPGNWGAPRNITFTTSGLVGRASNVMVSVTMTHTWVGDLEITLHAPGGQGAHVLLSRVGATSSGSSGDSSNLSGTYTFSDGASANPWSVATSPECGGDCIVTPQLYRTTVAGPTTNPAAVTSMNAFFNRFLFFNGTWTLSIRDGTVNDIGSVTAATLTVETHFTRAPFDFDNDDKTDYSVFVPGSGEWWYLRSSDNASRAFQFGASSDIIAPADFTGDGKTDIAFFRPATGFWYVLRSEDLTYFAFPFGQNGDIPVPADYDFDFKADPAVYRPGAAAMWYINRSTGGTTAQQFGGAGDLPIPEDYDADGKTDVAIYRPSVAEWWLFKSRDGVIGLQFGLPGDKTVVADYTFDGRADVAFFRPSTGEWFILRSQNLSYYSFPFGQNGDIPVVGDFDGDGKSDPTVFRPSAGMWFVNRSTGGTSFVPFGTAGSIPVPAAYGR